MNGYTKGARNELFALKPAPIQVWFMSSFCNFSPYKHDSWQTNASVKYKLPHLGLNLFGSLFINNATFLRTKDI